MAERGRRDWGELVSQVLQARQERPKRQYFITEQYSPDGEIEEAWEDHLLEPGHAGVEAVIILSPGGAEPRTDWRERGVVPPRGFHRREWGY